VPLDEDALAASDPRSFGRMIIFIYLQNAIRFAAISSAPGPPA
jgi:hypothetical protein